MVIESFPPGALAGWGLGFNTLPELRPGLVLTSITPVGQDGPYAAYRGEEIIYYAMGGLLHATGLEEREPVKLGANIIQYQCGNLAATATLAALESARRDGEAKWVDLSHFETPRPPRSTGVAPTSSTTPSPAGTRSGRVPAA